MLRTIELNDELQFSAIEVHNKPGDRVLASELEAKEPPPAKDIPSPLLSEGCISPQVARLLNLES